MPDRHRCARTILRNGIGSALLGLLVGTAGCDFSTVLIHDDVFVDVASDFVLGPSVSCETLSTAFGLPHVPIVADPNGIRLAFEEARIVTTSGDLLRVWYIPSPLDRGTILFNMGAVGDISCYLFIPLMLHQSGWSFVMYDFQGFGDSSGAPTLASLQRDVDAALDWTLARTGREQVTLYGVSIGTLTSVAAAARRPDDVNAVILDGPIDFGTELGRFGWLLAGPIELFLEQLGDDLRMARGLPKLTQPTLAFIYGRDEFLTSSRFPALADTATAEITVAEFGDLPHARGPYLGTASYFYRVEEFLTAVWTPLTDRPASEDSLPFEPQETRPQRQ